MTTGRPSDYDDSYKKQAYQLCLLGATDEKLAEFFECNVSTIHAWKLAHTDFSDSIKSAKWTADAKVATALYDKAIGYTRTEEKMFMDKGKPFTTEIKVFYPPDTHCQIFWLKNRQRDLWSDRQDIAHSGAIAHSEMDIDQLERRKAELEAQLELQGAS